MAVSPRTASILFSVLISAGLIGGAFYLSGDTSPSTATAESTEELLRAYAKQDTDGDGLHDWQEELYASDPGNPNSLDPVMTDLEAVESGRVAPRFAAEVEEEDPLAGEEVPGIAAAPDTLTDRFARDFFSDYLTSGAGSVPTEDDLISFVDGWIEQLAYENTPTNGYTSSLVTTVPGTPEAYKAYAAQVESALRSAETNLPQTELDYFADTVHKSDVSALPKLRTISAAYKKSAATIALIPVPTEAASAHLTMVNALSRLSVIVQEMAEFQHDPLLAFVGISSYETTMRAFVGALAAYDVPLAASGAVFGKEDAGYAFYALVKASAQAEN